MRKTIDRKANARNSQSLNFDLEVMGLNNNTGWLQASLEVVAHYSEQDLQFDICQYICHETNKTIDRLVGSQVNNSLRLWCNVSMV